MIRLFDLSNEGISAGTELVRDYLGKKGVRGKELERAVLIARNGFFAARIVIEPVL